MAVADFQGGWWDISTGPQKNCQLKPPPQVKLGGIFTFNDSNLTLFICVCRVLSGIWRKIYGAQSGSDTRLRLTAGETI